MGETTYTGPGAGATPTANSILSDLLATGDDIVKGNCGREFNSYRKPATAKPLTAVPQRYLITVEGTGNLLSIVSNIPTVSWQQQATGQDYWSGLTPVIDHDELEQLCASLQQSGQQVTFLPVANSWQTVPEKVKE